VYRTLIVVAALNMVGCYGARYRAPATAPHFYTIASGSFVVQPRTYTSFKVNVPEGTTRARVDGRFSASGANNDIEVLLLEEHQYLNWQNAHRFRAAYESGRVTADKLAVDLPAEPATYYMVFDNRFSMLSNKGVAADVNLRCEGPK
jgi:hypothetical protein